MERMTGLWYDQLMCFCTHQYIGRFDADDQIVIAHIFDHMHFIQGTLHDPFCRHAAVFFHQVFFQRTTVYTDTNRNVSLFGRINYSLHTLPAADISRIDADLVGTVFDRRDRQFIVKMNIRYQWDRNLLFDLFQCTRSFLCRNCTSYNIASCCSQSLNLCHSCPHIFCFCICHGLDQDRISASDHPVADLYHFCMFSVHKSDLPNVSKADQNRIPSLTYVRLDFTIPVFHISQNNIPDQNTSAHRSSP